MVVSIISAASLASYVASWAVSIPRSLQMVKIFFLSPIQALSVCKSLNVSGVISVARPRSLVFFGCCLIEDSRYFALIKSSSLNEISCNLFGNGSRGIQHIIKAAIATFAASVSWRRLAQRHIVTEDWVLVLLEIFSSNYHTSSWRARQRSGDLWRETRVINCLRTFKLLIRRVIVCLVSNSHPLWCHRDRLWQLVRELL